jgi:4'-phosphopantetheinyl transferase
VSLALSLADGDVHVWSATSLADHIDPHEAWALLDPDERSMIGRLRNQADRDQRVQARAMRRLLIAGYVGADPAALWWRHNSTGKPELGGRPRQPSVRFNMTHSGAVILLAVAADRELGVDVEQIQADFAWEQVASSSLSAAEVATICSLPDGCRTQAFFDCWVRKEAYLKGLGEGLTRSPQEFEVPIEALGPDGSPVLDPGRRPAAVSASDWRLYPVELGPRYAGALAVAGAVRITYRPVSQFIAARLE